MLKRQFTPYNTRLPRFLPSKSIEVRKWSFKSDSWNVSGILLEGMEKIPKRITKDAQIANNMVLPDEIVKRFLIQVKQDCVACLTLRITNFTNFNDHFKNSLVQKTMLNCKRTPPFIRWHCFRISYHSIAKMANRFWQNPIPFADVKGEKNMLKNAILWDII